MSAMQDGGETRRALCAFETEGLPGAVTRGDGEAVVDDDGATVAGVRVEFLNADAFTDELRVLTLGLYPSGALRISRLGRRPETFSRALSEARDAARVRGILAHGLGIPQTFDGAVLDPGPPRAARLFVYPTHVTAVPIGADPFQIPLGTVTDIRFAEGSYQVALVTAAGATPFGQLARQTEAFARAVRKAHADMLERCARASGTNLFADGRAVSARDLGSDFERLLVSWSAPERLDGARGIMTLAGVAGTAIGLAELLDRDEATLAANGELPENTASFLLASVGSLTILELLSGPSAATYVFRAPFAVVAADLAALHFRRRGLALTEAETAGPAGRPYRLALRRLDPLRRLRAATVARVIHDEWTIPKRSGRFTQPRPGPG